MAVAEFIVAFREFFEISLLVGIMLAYLGKTRNQRYSRDVWMGVVLAGLASVGVAGAFKLGSVEFADVEALFEGITLLLAAVLVTWLILWMMRQKKIAQEIEDGLKTNIDVGSEVGVTAFSFISVFREGVEIVLFIGGISLSTGAINFAGVIVGALAAIALGYLVFNSIVKLNLRSFFTVTSAILILLAAGLVSQGVHELEEARVLPPLVENVYDFTPAKNADGSYPLLHEKGALGGVLKGLVGYDTNPSLMQVLAYLTYLLAVYFAYRRTELR